MPLDASLGLRRPSLAVNSEQKFAHLPTNFDPHVDPLADGGSSNELRPRCLEVVTRIVGRERSLGTACARIFLLPDRHPDIRTDIRTDIVHINRLWTPTPWVLPTVRPTTFTENEKALTLGSANVDRAISGQAFCIQF